MTGACTRTWADAEAAEHPAAAAPPALALIVLVELKPATDSAVRLPIPAWSHIHTAGHACTSHAACFAAEEQSFEGEDGCGELRCPCCTPLTLPHFLITSPFLPWFHDLHSDHHDRHWFVLRQLCGLLNLDRSAK